MVKVSVFYPAGADTKFDWNYYLTKHMPMVQATLGPVCKKTEVDQGLGGGQPGAPAAFVAVCHLHFDSVDALVAQMHDDVAETRAVLAG